MTGFIYRTAIRIKDLGERLHCDWIIRAGLALRETVLNRSI
jgi:hypothetical protein